MIIYIHGFGSCGEGSKARLFRGYFKDISKAFIAPSLSYVPELAIGTLEELIASYDGEVQLIGSSLGGYYTMYLAHKYGLRAVLINPSIFPYKTLGKPLDNAPNFYDLSGYEWKISHINMLKKYEVERPNQENTLLLLQKGDTVLDYAEALAKLPNSKVILEENGSHSFDGIERYFETINDYFEEKI